jgi:uncharacterized protein YndB with AHSA1/START domain
MADTYTVTRSATIQAPPEKVWSHVVDFHRWQAWSPWEGMDPNQERTYSGPESGVGSHYAWSGNRKVGQGSMEITEADAPRRLEVALEFVKPFKSSNTTTLELAPDGDGTRVTWTIVGPMTLMTKMMSAMKSMDAMLGPDFERGLAGLKAVSEK